MNEPVSRTEHKEAIDRVHDRVDSIKSSVDRQEVMVSAMKENSDKMFKILYGNGHNGIISKLAILCSKINVHFWLIGLIVAGIISLAFKMLAKG